MNNACACIGALVLIAGCSDDSRARTDTGGIRFDAGRDARGDGGPPVSGKRIFVTAASYSGAFTGSGGLTAATSACQLAADAEGLGGTWQAWISNGVVHAIDRVTGPGPWVNMRGELVFMNRAGLEVSAPRAPMGYDESGARVEDFANVAAVVWTGSDVSGHAVTDTCDGWTSDSSTRGITGWVDSDVDDVRAWTANGEDFCSAMHHLICFEL